MARNVAESNSIELINNTGAIDVKMDKSLIEENSSFKMLGLSSFLTWSEAFISYLLLKLSPRNLEPWFILFVFFCFSPEVDTYLYQSAIRPCMEYCFHVWAGAPGCYLEMSDKLQKRRCRTVGPSLAASLETLAHRRNIVSLSLFYSLFFSLTNVHLNWLNCFHFLILERGLLVILIDCITLVSAFLDVTRMYMLLVSFLV